MNHQLFDIGERPFGPADPQIGDSCEVENECIVNAPNGNKVACYELVGYDHSYYNQRNFSVITDLDETTLVSEEFEEKYCETVK